MISARRTERPNLASTPSPQDIPHSMSFIYVNFQELSKSIWVRYGEGCFASLVKRCAENKHVSPTRRLYHSEPGYDEQEQG